MSDTNKPLPGGITFGPAATAEDRQQWAEEQLTRIRKRRPDGLRHDYSCPRRLGADTPCTPSCVAFREAVGLAEKVEEARRSARAWMEKALERDEWAEKWRTRMRGVSKAFGRYAERAGRREATLALAAESHFQERLGRGQWAQRESDANAKLRADLAQAHATITQLRCAMDRADCTHREGGDTRHCALSAKCLRCERDAERERADKAEARVKELEALHVR